MNLKQLEAFLKLATNKSFSLTAKELFLTQPTVSAHIQSLEEELSTKLFVRNTRDTRLTKEGEKLYRYVRDMMKILDDIKIEFKKEEIDIKEEVLISSSSIPSSYMIPSIISKLVKQYPKMHFKIKETDSAGVIKDIKEKVVDIGFTGTILDKKSCVYIPFYEDKLVIIMPNTEEYRKICEEKKDFSFIEKFPVIMREDGSGTKSETEKFLKKQFKDLDKLKVIAKIDNTNAIINSVKKGLGISIVSELSIKEYEGSKDILIYPKILSKRKFYIVYNADTRISTNMKILINVVHSLYNI